MRAILYSVVWEAFSERWCVSWNPNNKVSQPYQNSGRPFQVTVVSHQCYHVSIIVSNAYKHSTQIHFDRWAWGRNTNGGPKPDAHITYVYVVSNDTVLQIKRNLCFYFGKYIVLKTWKSNEFLDFLGSILEHGVVERANSWSEACPPSSHPWTYVLPLERPHTYFRPHVQAPSITPVNGHPWVLLGLAMHPVVAWSTFGRPDFRKNLGTGLQAIWSGKFMVPGTWNTA